MLFSFNNQRYALGLSWSVEPTMAEVRTRLKSAKGGAYARVENESDGTKEFHVGMYDGRVSGAVFSAALAIAAVESACVVHHSIDESTVWICVVWKGLPLPGRDLLVTPEEADRIVSESMEYADVLIGDIQGAKATVPETLGAFDGYLSSKQLSKKQVESCKVKNQPRLALRLLGVAAVAALAVTAVGGLAYLNHLREQNRLSDLNLQRLAKSAEEAEREAQARALRLQQFRDDVASRRAQLAKAQGAALARWDQWDQLRQSLPVSLYGYRPESMDCDEKACLLTWTVGGMFVRPSDRRALPNVQNPDALGAPVLSRFDMQPVTGVESTWNGVPEALRARIFTALELTVPGLQVAVATPLLMQAPADLKVPAETIALVGRVAGQFRGSTALVEARDMVKAINTVPVVLKSSKWTALSSFSPSVDLEAEYIHVEIRP